MSVLKSHEYVKMAPAVTLLELIYVTAILDMNAVQMASGAKVSVNWIYVPLPICSKDDIYKMILTLIWAFGCIFCKSTGENKVFINGFKNYTVAWHSRESSCNNVQRWIWVMVLWEKQLD